MEVRHAGSVPAQAVHNAMHTVIENLQLTTMTKHSTASRIPWTDKLQYSYT